MANVGMKAQVLRRSISSLNKWLETSQQLLSVIPMELEANNEPDRRELALKYKDLLLQIREKGHSMQEINSLYQEIDSHDKSQQLVAQLAEISASIAELNTQFTNTCLLAKKQYNKLAEKIASPVASSPVSRAEVGVTTQDACNLGQSRDKQGLAPNRHSSIPAGPIRPHSASSSHFPRPSTPYNNLSLLSISPSSLGSGSPLPIPRPLTAPSSPMHQSQLGVSLSCDKLSLTSSPSSSPFPTSRKAMSSEGLAEGGQWDALSTQSSQSVHSMRSLQNRVISGFGTSTDSLNSGFLEGSCHNSQSQGSDTNLLAEGISPCEGSGVGAHRRDVSVDSVQSLSNTPPVINPVLPQFSPRAVPPVETVRPNKPIMSSQSLPLSQPAKSPIQSFPSQPIRSAQQPNLQSNQQPNQSNPQSNQSNQQPSQSNPQSNQSNQQPNQSNPQSNQSSQQPNQSNPQSNQSNQQSNQSSQQPNQSNPQLNNPSVQKPVQDAEELTTLLARITNQVQDCIHNMTQHKGCALDRAVMEKHVAEIKGIQSILGTQESVLFQLLATFSPSVRRKLTVEPATPTSTYGYPAINVVARKDEIVKLSDRVGMLGQHCKQVLGQAEEVLAMVTQHAGQVVAILEDLGVARGGVEGVKRKGVEQAEESWDEIRKAKMTLDASKQKMAALGQLSLKLLQLEPTFDGTVVRREQERISKEHQRVAPAVTNLLEILGKARVERLQLETAVVVSWVTMTEMTLHSGEEERPMQELMTDIATHQHTITSLSSDLQDILALTPLDDFTPVQEVRAQIRELTHSLASMEQRLKSRPHKDTSHKDTLISADHLTTPPPTPPGYDSVPVPVRFPEPLPQGDGHGAQTILYDVPPATMRDVDNLPPQVSLHGDLLSHIANEWMGLCDEKFSPEDMRDVMDSIGKVSLPEQRARLLDLLHTLYGMTRSLQNMVAQIAAIKIPTQPSLEKIHACLDECQMLHIRLNTTANLLNTLSSQSLPLILLLPRTPDVLRLSLLLETRLFDLSLLHCRVTQRLQSLGDTLHCREHEANSLYREVHILTSSVLEGARVLESGEEAVTDAAMYIEKCKALHSTLSSLSEKRLALNTQMREWSVSDPRSPICGKLMQELGNVDREWDRILTGLSEVPMSEARLYRQMVRNILKEVVAMEANLPRLQSRTVELKQVTEKLETCATYLEQSKVFSQSLKTAKKVLRDVKSPSPQATVPLEPSPPSPIRRAQVSASENGNAKNGNGPTAPQSKGSGVRLLTLVEMVITPRGPALTAFQSPAHMRDQCQSVMMQVEQLKSSLETAMEVLKKDKARLERFYAELEALESWLALMGGASRTEATPKNAMAMSSGAECVDQVVGRQTKFEALQTSIPEVMGMPGEEEEKKKLERRVLRLYLDWDEVCLKYVPPGILPLLYSPFTTMLQAPARFEDALQMLEWLILIESKLQPERMVVGDFSQLRGMLHMLQIIEREMKGKQAQYMSFMKGEVEGPEDPTSSLLPSTKGTPLPLNKCVKFIDENTLQRVRRKQEIKSLVARPRQEGSGRDEAASSPPLARDPSGTMATSPHTQVSPTTSLADSDTWQCQLSLLWKGIWTTLGQWKQRLELVQDIWKAFEGRKEVMVTFMCGAEGTLKSLLPSLNCAKDFQELDVVVSQYKRLTEDMAAYDQKLCTLKSLASNLLNHHHSSDDSKEFQVTMDAINKQWSDLKDNLTKLQGVLEPFSVQWTSFYSLYHPFIQWLNNMDFEMASMNPFVSDMATIQSQLDKQKEIQQQVTYKEGTLEKIQTQGSKLLQGAGGSYINHSFMHKKLEGMAKTWRHVQTFATERTAAFEQAMVAKQETLAQLSKCLVWMSQAEKHLASQKPLGADFSQVHTQYEAHQAFWKDVLNQKPQVDSLAASGRFAVREASNGKTTAECVSMESTQDQFTSLQERWRALLASGELWGELLEKALPEMEKLQSLRIECAHRLNEAEAKITSFEVVSNKFLVLIRQLDSIKELEVQLATLGDLVGVASMSQQHLLELGISPNATCMELVSKMASRFGELKQSVASRHVTIEKAMLRFECSAGMAPLPDGWHRAKTEKGTPYYIQTGSGGNHTQWQHPELSELYKEMQSMCTLPFYPAASYPVALKLRTIQKKTRFEVLSLQHVIHCYKDNPKGSLTASEMVTYSKAMFQYVEGEFADKIAMGKAIELTTSWIRDVFDKSHEGTVSMMSFQIATICMSNGKLDNKYRSLFKVISSTEDGATIDDIANFLLEAVQIPLSCSSTPSQNGTPQMIDACTQDCFKKYGSVGKLSLVKFLQWVQTEPEPVAWLPILHRLGASDSVQHNVTCTICQMHPIVGFRYRCMDCVSLDLCQECYWAGKSTKEHDRSTHYMEEYCIAKEEGKDFLLKALRKSLRKKRDGGEEASSPGLGRTSKGSPAIKKRHSTYIETSINETDKLEIRSKPLKGIPYFTPPPTRRIATDPQASSPPLPIRTRLASHHKNSPTELDQVVPSPPRLPHITRGQPRGPQITSPPPSQPYMTPLPRQANGPLPPPPPRINAEYKNQLLNGGYVPDPQGAVPEGSYNPYGVVHTHHRTAQGTVTTTTTVC